MLSIDARPETFSQVAGNELAKKTLKAIVKKKHKAPRSIVLYGPFGCSKTTNSRILARALNCEHPVNGEPCLKCSNCSMKVEDSPFYVEYDAAVVGNVDAIRDLRDTFHFTIKGGIRVIVIDECHVISRQGQTALLKCIEEAPEGVLFIFPTTHPDQLLPTIRSRSMEIRVETVSIPEIIKNIKSVLASDIVQKDYPGVTLSEETMSIIATNSQGHMRNVHMLLDKCLLMGEEDFRETVKSSRGIIANYFYSLATRNKDLLMKSIDELLCFPISSVEVEFYKFILDMTENIVLGSYPEIQKITSLLGNNTLKLVKMSQQEWVHDSFKNDVMMRTCLLAIYQLTEGLGKAPVAATSQIRTKK